MPRRDKRKDPSALRMRLDDFAIKPAQPPKIGRDEGDVDDAEAGEP